MRRLVLCLVLCLGLLVPCYAESPEEAERPVRGYVALTFDDGPSGALTEELLEGLRQRNARATFFLCGYRMEQFPDLMAQYLADGHELGVHSTVHTDLTKLTPEELHQDMGETARQIEERAGVRPVLMRPPGGAYDEAVLREAREEGLSVILWSVDPRDWATHDAAAVLKTMARNTGGGDVILMHDLSHSSVTAALRLVDQLQQQGYCFVTVSELARLTGTELAPGAVYERFRPGGEN